MGWRGAKRGKERPAGDSVCVYMYTPWKSRQSTKRKIFLAVLAGRRKKLYMIERERERVSICWLRVARRGGKGGGEFGRCPWIRRSKNCSDRVTTL